MPIAHVSFPVSSLSLSKAFYEKALKPLNYVVYGSFEWTVGFAPPRGGPDFWVHQCPQRESGKELQKTHLAFVGRSHAQVKAFYDAALKAGAKDNGKPGERSYQKGYYAAYVLDPDGNNVECVYYQPLWLSVLQVAPMTIGAVMIGGLSWWVGLKGWSV